MGPLGAEAKAVTRSARLGVCGRQTGAPWPGTSDADRAFPGSTWQGVEDCGPWLGVCLGEALEGRDRHVAMMWHHALGPAWVATFPCGDDERTCKRRTTAGTWGSPGRALQICRGGFSSAPSGKANAG